jgi:ADP-heptose:LPS heptosyltransferase
MKKVLIWHQGALGDLILSLPAVYAIKNHRGGAGLHIVCRGDMSDIIVENNLAEEVTSNEKGIFGRLFEDRGRLPPDLKAFLAGFDGAFVFMRNRHDAFLDNVRLHIHQCHHISTFPPPGVRMHVPRYQLEQLSEMGIDTDEAFPVLNAGSGRFLPEGPPFIAVHPGSGGRNKCWPLRRYMRLMEELHREGEVSFVVILGPAEDSGKYETLKKFIAEKGLRVEIIRDMPVSGIARVLKKAAFFIGNDSGIAHLASALGTPALVIFGPTDHEVWKPAGVNVGIVRSVYPCSPCREEAYRRCAGIGCLEGLTVETVLEEFRRAGRIR